MTLPGKSLILAGLILSFTILKSGSVVLSADNEYTRPSLTGLRDIAVVVESLSAEMMQEGLSQKEIESDVIAKLQSAGIQVLTEENGLWVAGIPYLYVNINGIKSKEYFYHINLEFHQDAFLERNTRIKVDAVTWSRRYVGASPHFDDIRTVIEDMIGIFINAFLSVNPR